MKKLYVLLFLFLSQCMYTAPLDNEIIADPEPDTQVEETVTAVHPSEEDDDYRRRSEECEGDRDCEKTCSKIFRSRGEKEECEESYDVDQVEDMEEVFEILEKPDEDDLEDLDLNDLERILSISIEPVVDEAKKYSSSETRDFLAWILNDDQVATLLFDEDDEYELLETLLGNLNSDPVIGLTENIDGGDSFMEIAADDRNEELLEKVHDYLQEGGKDSDECNDDQCTFNKYCRMNLNPRDVQGELLRLDFFEDFIDDLIDSVGRDSEQADELDDFDKFCKNSQYTRGSSRNKRNTRNSNSRNSGSSYSSGICKGKKFKKHKDSADELKYFHFASSNDSVKYCDNSGDNCDNPSNSKVTGVDDISRNSKGIYTFTFNRKHNNKTIVKAIFKEKGASSNTVKSVKLKGNNAKKRTVKLPKDSAVTIGIKFVFENTNGKCKLIK